MRLMVTASAMTMAMLFLLSVCPCSHRCPRSKDAEKRASLGGRPGALVVRRSPILSTFSSCLSSLPLLSPLLSAVCVCVFLPPVPSPVNGSFALAWRVWKCAQKSHLSQRKRRKEAEARRTRGAEQDRRTSETCATCVRASGRTGTRSLATAMPSRLAGCDARPRWSRVRLSCWRAQDSSSDLLYCADTEHSCSCQRTRGERTPCSAAVLESHPLESS